MRLKFDRNFCHFLDEFCFCFAIPGCLPMKHFVDHDADGPDIVFDGVNVSLECFWRHVERTAYIILLFF